MIATAVLQAARDPKTSDVLREKLRAVRAVHAALRSIHGEPVVVEARALLAEYEQVIEKAQFAASRFDEAPIGDLLTTHQAARILGVTPMTVIRDCEQGKLEFSKTRGGHRRIKRESLEQAAAVRGIQMEQPPKRKNARRT